MTDNREADEVQARAEEEGELDTEEAILLHFQRYTESRAALPWSERTRREKISYYLDRFFVVFICLAVLGYLAEATYKTWYRDRRFVSVIGLKMRYVAAYLLAVLGGNNSPSSKDIKHILGSVGIEADDERLNKVISELNGKDINQVMNSGLSKLTSVPAGGAVMTSAAAAGGGGASAAGEAPAAEEKKEEKKEESEESDEDMGFGLFD
ncbi:hypothetical protein ACEWY4_013320 [Coilia grayii]|uniref:Large ribosomal subunit protein P2 n=1 Tax=Coilia grayii TaxID=363190 RepID=A0ABD1JW09_9TELE